MYLNRLSNEQKELFLDLCIHASNANGDFDANEKLMIDLYCDEMNIAVRYEARYPVSELAAKLFEISTKAELKMILIETASLLLSDSDIDSDEQAFIDSMTKQIGMSEKEVDEAVELLNQIRDVYGKINDFIYA